MIVRNEAGCIKRCLRSVRGLISYWVIADTGSTDNTCEILQSELAGIPGELYHDAWHDFAHNRNLVLQRAKGKGDYHLLLDADMTLNVMPGLDQAVLTEAGYHLRFTGDNDYKVIRLISDGLDWVYRGVVHEHIQANVPLSAPILPALTVTHHEDGGCRGDKFQRERATLERGLKNEPENARYAFYLAQTYRDLGEITDAIQFYSKRLTMEGWEEETWYSAYQLARCKQAAGSSWPEVMHAYLEAYQMRPWRLEPLLPLCQTCRSLGQFALAHMFSKPVLNTPYPDDLLFIERPVYEYALLTEHAIASYWVGEHEEAVRLNELILKVPNLPTNYHASALRNLGLSLEVLGRKAA